MLSSILFAFFSDVNFLFRQAAVCEVFYHDYTFNISSPDFAS